MKSDFSDSKDSIFIHAEECACMLVARLRSCIRMGSPSVGRCTTPFRVGLSWYPGIVENLNSFRIPTNTRTVSCIAKFCPGQDRAPAENAKKAFRKAGRISLDNLSDSSRSTHRVEPSRRAQRSGRNSSGRGKTRGSCWISHIGMNTCVPTGTTKFPLILTGFVNVLGTSVAGGNIRRVSIITALQ